MNYVNVEIISEYIPQYSHQTDACVDLVGDCIKDSPTEQWFKTGVKVNIPEGYVGLVFARSSISKKALQLANGVGVIDSGYTGEIQVRFRKTIQIHPSTPNAEMDDLYEELYYQNGDRVAQMMILPLPTINFIPVKEFNEPVERGDNGFGSTGS